MKKMSDISWMDAEAYDIADRISQALSQAYKQGVSDAWSNAQLLWSKGTFSIEWSTDEMMRYAEIEAKHRKDVEELAERMGIHALYAEVVALRGEGN